MNENGFLDKAINELKKATANSSPPQQVVDKTMDRLFQLENEYRRIPNKGSWIGFLKMAAAAAIILTAGLYAGRLTKPAKLDTEQLAALEKTLKTTLQSQIQKDLQEKIAEDFQSLITINNTQLNELTDSIDESQKWERVLISLVLEQMELDRYNENKELRNALVTFAAQTEQKLTQTELTLAKITEKNNTQKSLNNQKDNLQ